MQKFLLNYISVRTKLSDCICLTTEAAKIKLNSAFQNEISILVNLIRNRDTRIGMTMQKVKNKIENLIGSVPAQGGPFAGKPPNENLVKITKC